MIIAHDHVRIVSQCPTGDPQARIFEAEARYCSTMLLHHRPETFDCSINLAPGSMEVSVPIKNNNILQQLPFLQDLRNSITEAAPLHNLAYVKGVLQTLASTKRSYLSNWALLPYCVQPQN